MVPLGNQYLQIATGNYEILEQCPGADQSVKSININGKEIHMDIYTIAGNESYQCLYPYYFRGAHAIIIVFAVGNTCQTFAEYFETSSVTGQGIEEMFNFIYVLSRNQLKK